MRNIILSVLLICFCFSAHAQMRERTRNYTLLFKSGKIQTTENRAEFSRGYIKDSSTYFNEKHFLLVQFYALPTNEQKEELKKEEIELFSYIPNKSFYVSASDKGLSALLSNANVRYITTVKPEWKISELISGNTYPDYSVDEKGNISLIVTYFSNLNEAEITKAFVQHDVKIKKQMTGVPRMVVSVPFARIRFLATLPFIEFIEPIDPPSKPENIKGATDHRSNAIYESSTSPLHFNGAGVKVSMGDDGRIGPHIDYQGRVTSLATVNTGNHGDHVAGTIMGAGNINPIARGMAWGADFYVYNVWNNVDNAPAQYASPGIVITSTSYSNGCNAGYTAYAQTVDQQIRQNPSLMHVFSAGNDGTSNCGYGAEAGWGNVTGGVKVGKNVIAVGNLDYKDVLDNSSSRGPAKDGRIKPEVCAVGGDVFSTIDPNSYDTKTGTSMACPAVSGTLAQLYQVYKELNGGNNPESALMKAVLMNSADDISNPGPDFKTGFGRINALKVYKTLAATRYERHLAADAIDSTYTINIPAGTLQAKIMIYWNDYEGAVAASPALVNDLDLKVTDPLLNFFFSLVLNPDTFPATLNLNAVQGVDSLNNMEQVVINNPAAGTYDINISGFSVPQGPQPYYLTYEFITDEITLTYPIGGESFVPNVVEVIRWDAFGNTTPFSLDFSLDSGANWSPITSGIFEGSRYYNWLIPTVISGKVLVRVSRDLISDISDTVFSIMEIPKYLKVQWDCKDSLELTWQPVFGADYYTVTKLGTKYMDFLANTTDTFLVVTGLDSATTYWYSVQANTNLDCIGRRANAISKVPGENGCITGVNTIVSSVNGTVFPNPFHDKINIPHNSERGNVLAIHVFNLQGKRVFEENNFSKSTDAMSLDLSSVPAGIYFLKIISEKNTAVYKLCKM